MVNIRESVLMGFHICSKDILLSVGSIFSKLFFLLLLLLFSRSVVFDSLQPHGLQHTMFLCPSLYPGVCSDSYPLSRWCHPTISSSIITFSSCPQSFPASGSFPMSQLFPSSDSSHQVALRISSKVLELQHQSFQWISRVIYFRIDWFDLLAVQGTLKSLLQHHSSKPSILPCHKSKI